MRGTRAIKPRLVRGPNAVAPRHARRVDHDTVQTLRANDPRWVFALRVREGMQGSCLPVEMRQRLDRVGAMLNLNAFQRNLIVAIVQDAARREEPLQSAAGSLAMVPERNTENCVKWRKVMLWTGLVLIVEAVVVFRFLL